MSTLSIRSLPPDLKRALMREAKLKKTTKTEIVVEILKAAFGLSQADKKRQKLLGFFGKMTPQELAQFQETTAPFNQIDEEMWR